MSYVYNFILMFLLIFPTVGYSSSEKHKEYIIEREKLKCLYIQVGRLLKEGSDPVWILLTNKCDQTPLSSISGEKTDLPKPPSLKPDLEKPILKPDDILLLSRKQLECFRDNYEKMDKTNDPVTVSFLENCKEYK